ncbi:MAG TPA: asparagine--tRNA ligase [candidate division Zixibacteria bacterium]|nr:asparagine--tRNA ligase [candidate division Zixibacteria bacterium]
MPPRPYISDLGKYVGQDVEVAGWLYNRRSSGKIHFLLIRDGTGLAQGVLVKAEVPEEIFKLGEKITQESSLVATGKVRADSRAPGGYELSLTGLTLVQLAEDYPITPKEHGTAFLMEHRHLWLRSSRQHAILKVRDQIIWAIREFFRKNGFVLIDTPILTGSAAEGASTLFETEYFDLGKAYLAQTGQLYLEAACMSFGKVYCFGPTFRAEKSKTRRHLTEFWMVEPEVAFNDYIANMDLGEELVCYLVRSVLENCGEELKKLERDTKPLENIKRPFYRISYDEAVAKLQVAGSAITWGTDLGGEDETILTKMYNKPVYVYCYPKECKAFYMKINPENSKTVLCADLLAPEGYGEIIGGSQRADDYDELLSRLREHKLSEEAYKWYLDLRKYGSVPHSGFGLGVERTVAWLCGLPHVRETIPFARMLYRLYP